MPKDAYNVIMADGSNLDGLWTAEFGGIPNFLGGGVIVVVDNRIFGGDSDYYYTGLMNVSDARISAVVEVTSFVPVPSSIWGTPEKKFTVRLSGVHVSPNHMSCKLNRTEFPNVTIPVELTKRADLA